MKQGKEIRQEAQPKDEKKESTMERKCQRDSRGDRPSEDVSTEHGRSARGPGAPHVARQRAPSADQARPVPCGTRDWDAPRAHSGRHALTPASPASSALPSGAQSAPRGGPSTRAGGPAGAAPRPPAGAGARTPRAPSPRPSSTAEHSHRRIRTSPPPAHARSGRLSRVCTRHSGARHSRSMSSTSLRAGRRVQIRRGRRSPPSGARTRHTPKTRT